MFGDLARQAELVKNIYGTIYGKQFVELSEAINRQAEQIKKIVEPLTRQASLVSEAFHSYQKKYEEDKESLATLSQAGLILAPSMDKKYLERIRKYKGANNTRSIYTATRRYYSDKEYQQLHKLVKSLELNSIFKPRLGIVNDALWAHVQGKYTLSIPTLLAQIEGIIIDYRLIYDPNAKKVIGKDAIKETLDNASGLGSLVLYEGLTEFIETTVFKKNDFNKLSVFNRKKLNRHIVLHGRQLNYASEINSLRAFLILDVLALLLYQTEQTKFQRDDVTHGKRKKTSKH